MPEAQKLEALQTGVRGETYAYWYLRRLGYIFVARNYMPEHAKGELDLIGFDGHTLALVEVRTRLAVKGKFALPELNVLCILTLWPSTTPPANLPLFACTSLLSVPLSIVIPIGSSLLVDSEQLSATAIITTHIWAVVYHNKPSPWL